KVGKLLRTPSLITVFSYYFAEIREKTKAVREVTNFSDSPAFRDKPRGMNPFGDCACSVMPK
ncbi:MAG: hypothetical protein LBH16_10310, partial [Treponema sp.]|nr:hypothetical protein [Treponema sp.]